MKPDAYVMLELGAFEDAYFVEADCATESGPRITEKGRAYVRYWQSGREQSNSDVFPWVLWITTTRTRQELMVNALGRLPAEHWGLFIVTTAAEAVARMTKGNDLEMDNEKEVNQ